MRTQKGFTLVEVAVVVLVVGLLAFIGLRVWGTYSAQDLAKNTDQTTETTKIATAKDLDSVEKQLDNTDVVGSFENELDSQSDF